jgi:hypothetical protein
MSGWGVTGSRDTVRIVRPGGIVVVTLDAAAGRAVFDGLKALYGEGADARANLLRIKPLPWWRRLTTWLWWRKQSWG